MFLSSNFQLIAAFSISTLLITAGLGYFLGLDPSVVGSLFLAVIGALCGWCFDCLKPRQIKLEKKPGWFFREWVADYEGENVVLHWDEDIGIVKIENLPWGAIEFRADSYFGNPIHGRVHCCDHKKCIANGLLVMAEKNTIRLTVTPTTLLKNDSNPPFTLTFDVSNNR